MAFEDFTTEDASPLENFERESQAILARELLLEMSTTTATNGEASLKDDDFIEFSLEETQSLYGLEGDSMEFTLEQTAPLYEDVGLSAGYDAPSAARHASGERQSLDVQSLAQLLQLAQALGYIQEAQARPAAQPASLAAPESAIAAPATASAAPARALSAAGGAAPASGGDSAQQMTEMLKAMGPIAESLGPVLQEVLPQLIEQIGPMIEEMVPMMTEAVGGLASAI
jgi:hypothetical protein